MTLSTTLKNFIEEYIDLIDSDNLSDLYNIAFHTLSNQQLYDLSNVLKEIGLETKKYQEAEVLNDMDSAMVEFQHSVHRELPLSTFERLYLLSIGGLLYQEFYSLICTNKDRWPEVEITWGDNGSHHELIIRKRL